MKELTSSYRTLPFAVKFGLVILVSILIRFIFVPSPGFEADITFWKSWGLAPLDGGIVWSIFNTNNNYPTPFSYILLVVCWVYSLFADPHNFDQYWNAYNVLFLTIVKMLPILADMGIAGLLYWIWKNADKIGFPKFSRIIMVVLIALYLLNPVVIMDGAWWGQVDSLGVFIFMLALVLAMNNKPGWSGFIYMFSMFTKLQNMIYGPLYFMFVWQLLGYNGLSRALVGAGFAFFGLNFEFFKAGAMEKVVGSLTDNYDYFPLMSLNAYNLWWIVAKGDGMHISDKLAAIGQMNAKSVGMALFIGSYLLAALYQVFPTIKHIIAKPRANQQLPISERPQLILRLITGLILVCSGFFLFKTQSHERYIFPAVMFLLLWFPLFISELTQSLGISRPLDESIKKYFPHFLIGYGFFSLVFFLNLHTALIDNYPQHGIAFLTFLNSPSFTMPIAAIFVLLFFVFVVVQKPLLNKTVVLVPFLTVLLLIILGNLPVITGKSVYLSDMTPVAAKQEYGSRVKDMPVSSGFSFDKWTYLSDQYAFYKKGIGTHANGFIEYDINGMFKRITTDYGIDTTAGSKGNAQFEIYGDSKLLFQSPPIGRFSYPGSISVDITGVKRLGLVTRDAGDTNYDDHTDWLNAKLWAK